MINKIKATNGDYLNCPMSKEEYYSFVDELIQADCISLSDYENNISLGVRAGISKVF